MNKTVKYAGVAGILSLALTSPIMIFEVLKVLKKLEGSFVLLYIFVLLLSLIFYIIYIFGFKLIGEKLPNNLLKITSYILIISAIIDYGYTIVTLIFPTLDNSIVDILSLVIVGGISIPFGIALFKLKPQFGSLATVASVIAIITGVIEIIIGASLLSVILSVILSILGILLSIPLYILTSMILFRAAKKV